MKTNSLVQRTIIIVIVIIIIVYCIPEGAVTSQHSISFIWPHYKPIWWIVNLRCGPIVTCHKDKYIRTYDPPCAQIHFEKPYIFYTNRLINAILLNKERIASSFSNPVYAILSFLLSPLGMMPFKCYSFFSVCQIVVPHKIIHYAKIEY